MGDRYAMFEAIHGSAPRMVEEGLAEYANPSSILKACEMMLRHVGFAEKADRLAEAMKKCKFNSTCKAYTEYLVEKI